MISSGCIWGRPQQLQAVAACWDCPCAYIRVAAWGSQSLVAVVADGLWPALQRHLPEMLKVPLGYVYGTQALSVVL
jgi:hypothetical protein